MELREMKAPPSWREQWINEKCGCEMDVRCCWVPDFEYSGALVPAIRSIAFQRSLFCSSLHAEVNGIGIARPAAAD